MPYKLKNLKKGYVRSNKIGGKGNRQIKIGSRSYKKFLKKSGMTLKNRKIKEASDLLDAGSFAGVRKLVKQKQKFTNEQVLKFIDILSEAEDKKDTLKIKLTNGKVEYRTIKGDNIDLIADVLTKSYFEENDIETGSDAIDAIIPIGFKDIELVTFEAAKKVNNKSGSFFRFLNNTTIDLTPYQIISNEEQKDILKEHCLIYALQQCGINKKILNTIKAKFQTGSTFAKKNLIEVSEMIEKCIILHYNDEKVKKNKQTKFNKNNYNDIVNLCIFQNHYFIFQTTDISLYSSKNYKKVKDEKNFQHIWSKKNGYYKRNTSLRKCNSLQLVKNLYDSGCFIKDHPIITETIQYQKLNNFSKDIPLDNIWKDQKLYKCQTQEDLKLLSYTEDQLEDYLETLNEDEYDRVIKRYKKLTKKKSIWFADTETDTQTKGNHVPILIGCISIEHDKYEKVKTFSYNKKNNIVNEFLNYLVTNSDNNSDIIVYFHHLKYDFNVLVEDLNVIRKCEKDGQLYNVKILHNYLGFKKTIELRDSFKLFNYALSKFNKSFGLSKDIDKKEAIAFNYYTVDTIQNRKVLIEEYSKYFDKEETKKQFYENIVKNKDLFDVYDGFFNPKKYYLYYLRYDCLVLGEGLKKFKEAVDNITDNKLNLFNSLTISSLSNKYISLMGSFDDLYQVSGNLRDFISKAVTGGRVQCLERTKKQILNGKFADFDGVSLYPSAIYRLCNEYGLPTGKAYRIKKYQKNELDRYSYYVLKIKITKINKEQQLPMVSYKDKNGSLQYTNDAGNGITTYVDKYTLNDWVDFQDIEFEIIDGVYWNNGYNKKMGEVIKKIFTERRKYKKQNNNAMQLILKLMMNSAYGKTIIKKSFIRKQIVSVDRINNYIHNHYYLIKSFTKLNNRQYEVVMDDIDKSSNLAQVGTAVLSMSKRIMNEVFDIANYYNYPIYYTDTDSMHLNFDDVDKIANLYKQKYNRELIGKELCQFHVDFEIKDKDGNDRQGKNEDIYATQSIFLGKKCYIDKLESKDNNGKIIYDDHYRMKGVTVEGLKAVSKNKFGNNMFKLYSNLIDNELEILLNPKGKVMFEYKNNRVLTKHNFIRKLKF